ncbi:hypothetical protein ACX3VG_06620 [Escherichia coli]
MAGWITSVSYTHLRAHETRRHRVCRLLLENTSPLFSTCSQENQWAGPCRSRRTAGSP